LTENAGLPVTDESIVDFTWGLSFYFSKDKQEQQYGQDLKTRWDAILNDDDPRIKAILQSVNAATSATIYDLAQIRHQAANHLAFLDSVQKQSLQDLDDLAGLSKDAESIATRLAGVSVGGGVTFLASQSGGPYFSYIILGAGASYFLFDAILKGMKWWRAPKILAQTQQKKETFITSQIEPRYREQLSELLKKVHEIAPRRKFEEEPFKTELMSRKVTLDVARPEEARATESERRTSDLVNASAHIHANVFVTGAK
jgi:hypothetical protein